MQRTHLVDLHSPSEGGATEDEWGSPIGPGFDATPVAASVECNLQPLTGSVQQAAAGREIDATWKGFFPKSAPLREDAGIRVRKVWEDGWVDPPVSQPTAFRIRQVGYQGGRWDTEVMLGVTQEAIA